MSEESAAPTFRARVFYHWKKPTEKERHGFAMSLVNATEKTPESVIEALFKAYPDKLTGFTVKIDRLEWR